MSKFFCFALLLFSISAIAVEVQREIDTSILSNQGNLIEASDLNAAMFCRSKGYMMKNLGFESEEMIFNKYYSTSIHPNGDELYNLRYIQGSPKVNVLSKVICSIDI